MPNRWTAARTQPIGSASTSARSIRSILASSPACGVSTTSGRSRRCGTCGSPSASTTSGSPVASSSVSRSPGRSPQPDPASHAWTRPSARTTLGSTRLTASKTASGPRQRTMPAPAYTAPSADSTPAPGYVSEPVSSPTTPRLYLSLVASGHGHAAATSAACQATTSAAAGSSPMSTSVTAPHRDRAGSMSWHRLYVPKVTVRAALNTSPDTWQESASSPLGMSTATTCAPTSLHARASTAAGAGRPARAPTPYTPSTTTPTELTRPRAPAWSTSRPPASTSACQPPRWYDSAPRHTHTRTPVVASIAPAYSASPPLLPGPTRSSTLRDRFTSSSTSTSASPLAARCINSPSGSTAIWAASAARTCSAVWTESISATRRSRTPMRCRCRG